MESDVQGSSASRQAMIENTIGGASRRKAPAPVYSTLIPYLRRRLEFGEADSFGSLVAHHDLLVWSLRLQAVSAARVFVEQMSGVPNVGTARIQAVSASQEIPADVQAHVSIESVRCLSNATHKDLVFVGKVHDVPRLIQLRRASGVFFPTCVIGHSAIFPDVAGTYMSLLVQSEPCDVIVVTSTAGQRAVQSLLDQARGMLEEFSASAVQCVRPPSVVRIPLGVDDAFLQPIEKATARHLLNVDTGDIVILYVGRLSKDYKADLIPLVRRFHTLAATHKRVKLILAGSDFGNEAAPELRRIASEAGVASCVRVVSDFPPGVKRLLYASADIFVSPVDNVQETFGLSVLEAMASGLPVVVSNWSGYRDLVSHGVDGALIDTLIDSSEFTAMDVLASCAVAPYAEACLASATIIDWSGLFNVLGELVGDECLRESWGKAGKEKVARRYSWSSVIPQFRSLWISQMEHAAECKAEARTGHIHYGKVFEAYPSGLLDGAGATITSSSQAVVALKYLHGTESPLVRIADLCSREPIAISELLKHSPRGSRKIVVHLIKQGYATVKC